jgi:hypothetical protein
VIRNTHATVSRTATTLRVMTEDRSTIAKLCELWTPMWNGDTALTHDIVTDDFRIWFGAADGDPDRDALRGPDEFAALIRRHLDKNPGLTFAVHGEPVIDRDGNRATIVWRATLPDRALGGIDSFEVADGRFARCWSVTAGRDLVF